MHLRLHRFFITVIVFCLLQATLSETPTAYGTKIKTVYTKKSAAGSVNKNKTDYYWKRFDGIIPEDAFIGATNFGNNVYIGRGPSNEGRGALLIGAIFPGSNSIMVNNYRAVVALDSFLEILSCKTPCGLKWATASSTGVGYIPGVIEGGYEYSTFDNIYVGRTKFKGEYFIGEVEGDRDTKWSFSIHYVEGSYPSITSYFEVLTYSPDPGF